MLAFEMPVARPDPPMRCEHKDLPDGTRIRPVMRCVLRPVQVDHSQDFTAIFVEYPEQISPPRAVVKQTLRAGQSDSIMCLLGCLQQRGAQLSSLLTCPWSWDLSILINSRRKRWALRPRSLGHHRR